MHAFDFSDQRKTEFEALGVPTQMNIYSMIALIRTHRKHGKNIDGPVLNRYFKDRKAALTAKVEADFWFRPLMSNFTNQVNSQRINYESDQVSNRNVLVTGQRINYESEVIGAGGFSKIYEHKLSSSYEAVKVIDITGEFGVFYQLEKPDKEIDCFNEGNDFRI